MSKSWLSVLLFIFSFFLVSSSINPSSRNGTPIVSSCTPIPDGLVYWLRAENNADDYTTDHDGVMYGDIAFVPGMVGNAFSFDGIDDSAVIPSAAGLPTGSTPRTLEMWIYSVAGSWAHDSRPPFFTGIDSIRKAFGIDFDVYPKVQFYSWADDFTVTTTLPEEGWFHIALVYNGDLELTAYINGAYADSKTLGGVLETVLTNHFIGSGVNSSMVPQYFVGKIDEVSFYDRALSSTEIFNIFKSGAAGKCVYQYNYLPLIVN